MKILYISDFLWVDVLGGAELNDKEFLLNLSRENSEYGFQILRSSEVKYDEVKAADFVILSNFLMIPESILTYIRDNKRYMIYEHDHKYLRTRQPNNYPNFIAPEGELVHVDLYKKAEAVYVQSSFHMNIMKSNLGDDVKYYNCSGNFWGQKELGHILSLNMIDSEKEDKIAILDSPIKHKNTLGAIKVCEATRRPYQLIKTADNVMFINSINKYRRFLFIPETPETLSRVIVEAKMLNCMIMTNDNIGASYEPWFSLKGNELVGQMVNRMEDIIRNTVDLIENLNT